MDWTKEQKQAIYEKDSNILVAAAAGSGKTAVLVERIINKIINENVDIDKLLVVTFTNAAASEMRERVLDAIYKKLEENPENQNLQKQINLLNRASICTIDSFCLDVVRNYFYELDDISPNFRIGDTTEIELLKQEVMDELFEKKYEEDDENFTKLINTYTSYRDDTPLKEIVLKIYAYIQSNPFPKKWLNEKIEMFNLKANNINQMTQSTIKSEKDKDNSENKEDKLNYDFSKTIWGENLLQEIEDELIDGITTLQDVEESLSYDPELDKFQQTIRNDIDMLQNLKSNLKNWDEAYEIRQNTKFIPWPKKKIESEIKEQAKEIRDEVKEKINKVLDKILICDSKEAKQDIQDMYYILKKLENLILEFGEEFSKRKRERNLVDFNDIEHFALKILLKEENGIIEPTEVAKKYRQKYSEIAIDEYQDSNLVQEYILTSVSNGNNIFMVGDVKQSIYKFRQAMPELFLKKYETYKTIESKKENDNLKIKLFKNFRSRQNVLTFTNMIFQNIMSNLLGDIEYNKEEYLNLGADYPLTEQNLNTEIHIINLKEDEESSFIEENNNNWNEEDSEDEEYENNDDGYYKKKEEVERIEDIELEARFVANKIKKLVDSKFQIWDAKNNRYRDVQYKDIVILLRSTSNIAPIYEQEIINLDMPVFSDSSQEYLDSIEIQTIMSLLRIIDNPMQDIPLVTVLRSNIGKFTDDELVQIRLSDKYDNFYTCMQKAKIDVTPQLKNKIQNFLDNLDKWRKEQEYLALDELIWKIYIDTGYYNYVGLMPNGLLRQANLKMLFQRAKQYENSNFKGLYNFINFIEKLKLSSGDLGSAKLIGENDNVVRIMSIHKSKGLEFPVVFLSSTGKQFNLMDLNQKILLHQEMGIGVKYIDYEKQVKYDTLTKIAMRNKILVETLSEEMRILYVALTRAKEKLFITGLSKDYEKQLEKIKQQVKRYNKDLTKINPILVKKYKKYLDWILLVYQYEKNNISDSVELQVYQKNELIKSFESFNKEKIDIKMTLEKNQIDENNLEKLEQILNWSYDYELSTSIPTKSSVTKIKQMENRTDLEMIEDNLNLLEPKKHKEINLPKPQFLRENEENVITPAQKGTLVHLCFQYLDEKKNYTLETVKELFNSLAEKQIITKKEVEAISPYKVLAFTKSLIWKELKQAKKIEKEKPFYINVPAKEIYNQDTQNVQNTKNTNKSKNIEENILVQGIIDLYYINEKDELVLVDYKTDYVEIGKEKELLEKYQKQLDLYKKALESALNRKVNKIYIYSVYLEKEILNK